MIISDEIYEWDIFTDINCDNQIIHNTEFQDCQFIASSFIDTQFINCSFTNCLFKKSNLSLLSIPQSSFSTTRFEDSKCIGINWTKAHTKPSIQLYFEQCDIGHSSFVGLNCKQSHFIKCRAFEANFSETTLQEASFKGSNLEGTLFNHSDLTQCNFTGATHYHINSKTNVLSKAIFSLPEAMSLLAALDIVLE